MNYARRTFRTPRVYCVALALVLTRLAGCAGTGTHTDQARINRLSTAHLERFGNADLPRRIGAVENIGLQVPQIAPDGHRLLYLRTDQASIDPLTLCGEAPPADAHLSVWLRDVAGDELGHCVSAGYTWAHSPVWSPDGRAFAFVAATADATVIVHHDVDSGRQTTLGVAGQLNTLPRFDRSSNNLVFCTGNDPRGPCQIARQSVTDNTPTLLTPPGIDLLLPVVTNGQARVLCAQPDRQHLRWVQAHSEGAAALTGTWGVAPRPAPLQAWAGVTGPLAPDGDGLLYFDPLRERMGVLHIGEKLVRHHRRGTIAGCWVDGDALALATADGVFIVQASTGASVSVFNGAWIPVRYVAGENRLLLLGQDTPRTFAIWEVDFRPPARGI